MLFVGVWFYVALFRRNCFEFGSTMVFGFLLLICVCGFVFPGGLVLVVGL